MDYRPPGSSVHEILQATIQERVFISIRIGKEKVKLSLITYDMVLYVKNSKESTKQLLKLKDNLAKYEYI